MLIFITEVVDKLRARQHVDKMRVAFTGGIDEGDSFFTHDDNITLEWAQEALLEIGDEEVNGDESAEEEFSVEEIFAGYREERYVIFTSYEYRPMKYYVQVR